MVLRVAVVLRALARGAPGLLLVVVLLRLHRRHRKLNRHWHRLWKFLLRSLGLESVRDGDADPFVREPFENSYEILGRLASGTYGRVFECRRKGRRRAESSTESKLVVKVVPQESHPLMKAATALARKNCIDTGNILQTTEGEPSELCAYMSCLLRLEHQNVVRYREFFADGASFYFVMERCQGVEMVEHLLMERGWCEHMGRTLIEQTLEALRYIHDDIGLMHRDVKLENLMVQRLQPDGRRRVKLVDFGLGSAVASATGTFGTPGYIAPEVFTSGHYGANIDVFSAGVVLYILFTGRPPFQAPFNMRHVGGHVQALFEGPDLRVLSNVSSLGCNLLGGMLQPNPLMRLSSAGALHHEWFRSPGAALGPGAGDAVLWHSHTSEVQFLKVMGIWSGSGSKASIASLGDAPSTLMKIMEFEGAEDEEMDEEDLLEALCAAVVRLMPIAVTIADPSKEDCPLVAVSRGFTALTGYSEKQIGGLNCRFLSAPRAHEVSPATRKAMRQATQEKIPFLGVVPNRKADGADFANLLHISPLDLGSKVYLIGVQMEVEGDIALEEDVQRRREALDVVRKVHGAIRHWVRSSQGGWGARKLAEVGSPTGGRDTGPVDKTRSPDYFA